MNTGLVNRAPMSFSCGGSPAASMLVADRMLHPRVGRHDERGRQGGAEGDHPDVSRCTRREQPVPAEQPQAEERRLQEERGQPLHRQRRAEHVTDEREYADQFIPNWNSCTSPVTTPIAMLITSSVPKNRVSRRYASTPVRCHSVCSTAARNASPIVTGTNRKW